MSNKKRQTKKRELESQLDAVRADVEHLRAHEADVRQKLSELRARQQATLATADISQLERIAEAKAKAEIEIRKHALVLEEIERRIREQEKREKAIIQQLKFAKVEEIEGQISDLALEAANHLEEAHKLLEAQLKMTRETSLQLGVTPFSFFTSEFVGSVGNALRVFRREYQERQSSR